MTYIRELYFFLGALNYSMIFILSLCLVSIGNAQDPYDSDRGDFTNNKVESQIATVCLNNNTDHSLKYFASWGGEKQSTHRLRSGYRKVYSWKFDESGNWPYFLIRIDQNELCSLKTYALDSIKANSEDCENSIIYHFISKNYSGIGNCFKLLDDSGEEARVE